MAHTFVVQADLTRLACDVVLVPTDAAFTVTDDWKMFDRPPKPAGWGRTARVTEDVCHPRSADVRVRWLDVGRLASHSDTGWLLDGVREALKAAAKSVSNRKPLNGRAQPLVGLPVFGTGLGGFAQIRGDVLDGLLGVCDEAARCHGYDVVITCRRRADYAALQSRRLGIDRAWSDLTPDAQAHAARLGGLARSAYLALFLGAGVSKPAGLPTWPELIAKLAEMSSEYKHRAEELVALPPEQAAHLLSKALGSDAFQAAIRDTLSSPFYALGHALVASLRVGESITTNFDSLYEQACSATFRADEIPIVPPFCSVEPGRPWLLKLHGDLDRHTVLRLDDFLTFDATWHPLASMVQSAMMTRHVLFVGYSLSDGNFLRLGREVSRLRMRMEIEPKFGSVLALGSVPTLAAMWDDDLHVIEVGREETEPLAQARLADVFLDLVAAHAAADERSYQLDNRYQAITGPWDAVATKLAELGQLLAGYEDADSRWPGARGLLGSYGFRWRP